MPLVFLLYGLPVFLFGLCVGSFLNVVIYRLEKKEGFVKGRSYCPHCKHVLNWLDLIPVASFLLLRGKCRYCRKKISIQYPLVEVATGMLFLLVFCTQFSVVHSFSVFQIINLAFLWYIIGVLVIIFVYDLKYYLIPDNVLFPAIGIAFLFRLAGSIFMKNWLGNAENYIFAALIACGFFLAIFLVSRGRWMGFGDVKLAILLGLFLGFPNILAGLFLSFLFGAAVGIILLLQNKKGLKSEIPFAPFLIAGTGVAALYGAQIITWYLHFLVI